VPLDACRTLLLSEPPPLAVRVRSLHHRAEAALVVPRYPYRDVTGHSGRARRTTRMVRVSQAVAAVGKAWAPVLLAAIVWAFAWIYAQLPPSGEAVTAIQMEARPASGAGPAAGDYGHESAKAVTKQIENPISDANKSPARDDGSLASESRSDARDILSVQPVTSIDVSADWKPIRLTMPPLVGSRSIQPEPSVPPDRGTVTISVFLASHKPIDRWMLGAGRIVQAPTITGKTPGLDAWRVGPSLLVGELAGPIVARTYVDNEPSGGGMSGRGAAGGGTGGATGYGLFTVNPSAHYRFGDGWFVTGAPSFADDKLPDGADWTLPVGAQVGRAIEINGKLPITLLVGVYYDSVQPQFGSRWQLRTAAALMF
jgi:hypothetical protein